MLRNNKFLPVTLAVSVSMFSFPLAFSAPGEINSINTSNTIVGGTYLNTPGSRTTFTPGSSGGTMTLPTGSLLRGLEADPTSHAITGNGGTIDVRNPNGVVFLKGDVDVSAVRNGSAYTGSGGKLFVESAYLFQSGNVYANGVNGGLVQFNVGGMTLNNNAQINAQGVGGAGGSVNINSTGIVDLRTGSVVDTSGKVIGTFDTNVINIEGSAINNQGVIRANGIVAADTRPDNGDAAVMLANPNLANNPVPPPITAGDGTHDTATMTNILFATPGSADFRGGVIRLVAAGQSNNTATVITNADSQAISDADKTALNSRNAQIVQLNEGDVLNRGNLFADGALSKNGGTIIVNAAHNIINSATVHANGAAGIDGIFDVNGNGANGGNGGTISFNAMNAINNTANIIANGGQGARANSVSVSTANGADANATVTGVGGQGGQGGLIAFSSSSMTNASAITANGGKGGLGGHANSFDTENATAANPNPIAKATSVAGKGGAGGIGGLVVFSGNGNPTAGGSVQVNGGQGGNGGNAWADTSASSNTGTPTAQATSTAGAAGAGGAAGALVSPSGSTFTSGQTFSAKAGGLGNSGNASFRQVTVKNGVNTTVTGSTPGVVGTVTTGADRAIIDTRKNEYLRHEDTAMLLSQAGGTLGFSHPTLSGRLNDSVVRTVLKPTGISGGNSTALNDVEGASNVVFSSTTPGLTLTNNLVNSNVNPLFFNLNTLSILNNADVTNNTLWTPGVHLIGAGFHDMTLSMGGGHISWLANGNITNNQIVITRGLWSGGSTHVAATQDVVNNNDFINVAPNRALLSGFTLSGPLYESSHAGALTVKAGRDIVNNSTGKMETNQIFFDIHPPLNQNPPIAWPTFLNGAEMGATVNLLAKRNFTNTGNIGADALTYRNGALGAADPALTVGGIVNVKVGSTGVFSNTGAITANGNAFFSPNEADGPRFNTNTFPATTSFAGNVNTP
jgi:hypothetical protein